MDYSRMSDAEIGRRVANACNQEGGTYYNDLTGRWTTFDPCNNPADAWPVILSSKINIEFEGDVIDGKEEWWSIASWGRTAAEHQFHTDDNPLRAAMVAFLMMQESANVQGNPA